MKRKSLFMSCLKEMRVKSWIKNLFVVFPIVFSLELFQPDKLIKIILLTLAFCLISSAVYIFNDINDVENDRKHETKRLRPIAAGDISVSFASVLSVCLLVAGLLLACYVNRFGVFYIIAYIIINILYSKWLKKQPIIDCFCIAAGFVLRVMCGGTVVEGGVSDWMFLTIVSLSLFMAFGKRKGELGSYTGGDTRKVLDAYEMSFLDGSVFLCAGLSMVFYSLWSISQKSSLMYTVPIVLFIVIRYLFLVFKGQAEADPTNLLLSDKCLLVCCGLCALVIVGILYGAQIIALF